MRADSVQQERRPPDTKDSSRPSSIVGSPVQRIYLRKDLDNLAASLPNFVDKPETSKQQALLSNLHERLLQTDQGTFVLCSSMVSPTQNTDLSTLASVVTTLATMGKDRGGDSNVQMGIEAHEAEDLPNGETSSDSVISDQAARAFDVLTKALQPQPDQNENAENSMDQSNASGGSQEFDDDKSLVLQYEGPMLTDTNFAFNLTMPAPMPAYLTVHYICETASRLLFLSIHWARNIPAFQLINIELQIQLVQAYWSELFVLGLAQCSLTMNLSTILSAILNHLQTRLLHEKMPSERVKKSYRHSDDASGFR
jgi:hypothetical protein